MSETHQSAALRPQAAANHIGVSKATLYRLAKQPDFPKPRHLSSRITVFMRDEIDAYMANLSREVH